MATFVSFNDRLPDPTFQVTTAGSVGTGTYGPGFADEKVGARSEIAVSRTISGRGVHRDQGAHVWDISIRYNPMLRDQFDAVKAFLKQRGGGRRKPFYVVLADRARPKDGAFFTFAGSNTISVSGAHAAGSTTLFIDAPGAFSGQAKPGDLINIVDPNDTNHLKTYDIVAVETNALYQQGSSQPSTSQMRLHLDPPLTRAVADNAVVRFIEPKIRVMQKGNIVEYDLNTDNLFQFQLDLEEILP